MMIIIFIILQLCWKPDDSAWGSLSQPPFAWISPERPAVQRQL